MATYSALPATLNLVATVGNDFTLSLTVTENGSPWVATGATLATDIIDSSGAVVATDFTTAASTGTVSLSLTDANTTTLGVGVYSYRLSVTKSSLTRDWIAGTLSIVEAGQGGTSTSSASLSISNSAVSLSLTSLVAPLAENISVADAGGYYTGTTVEAVLAEQHLRTRLNEIPRNVVWAVGDSLTAGSPRGVSADSAAYGSSSTLHGGLMYQDTSWLTWALAASQAKWTLGGFAATGGYTAAQILSTHVPSVIAAATPGDVVVVVAGTNGNVLADVEAIHTALIAAGLRTIAVTIPPSTSSTLTLVAQFNAGLLDFAMRNNIPVADVHSVLVGTADGAMATALNSDGVHPNAAGFKVMGETIATVLNARFPSSGLLNLAAHNGDVTGRLQGKPLSTGAISGTHYNNLSALGTSTITVDQTQASFVGGKSYKFTRGDTDINARFQNITLVQGHRMRVGVQLIASPGGSGSWGMRLESNTTGTKIVWGFGYTTNIGAQSLAASTFYSEFTVPSLPDYGYRLRLSLTGASSVLEFGAVTIDDLTAMGL